LLATVRSNSQHPRLPHRLALLGRILHELGLGGLPVKFNGGAVAMQRTPGLDVGPVDRDRRRCLELGRDGSRHDPVGEPRSVNLDAIDDRSLFQHPAQTNEQPLHPVIGFRRIPLADPEGGELFRGHGVQDPGDLHQVALVVAMQGVHLRRHEEGFE
jgi:hypothetical protein